MQSLKLYLLLITEDEPVKITVHRDLQTLESEWNECDKQNTVGIIHISFLRPKPLKPTELIRYKGHILVTAATKWSLPDLYKTSIASITQLNLNNLTIPLHMLLIGAGFDLDEPDIGVELAPQVANVNNLTIVEAALQVLEQSKTPLNREEIFARIVEEGLYRFGAKKPVSVLDVELNRHSFDTNYSNPGPALFIKLTDRRYVSIENQVSDFEGWMEELCNVKVELAEKARSNGIFNEETYKAHSKYLSTNDQNELGVFRFQYFLPKVNKKDPNSIIRILPEILLNADVASINMPVRILNVFKIRGINTLSELIDTPTSELLKWPNFGNKSAGDLCISLLASVEKMIVAFDSTNTNFVENKPTKQLDNCKNDELEDPDDQLELASSIPLKSHFQNALNSLSEKERRIIEYRTGYHGQVLTLESVGEKIGVTRERIRQIQKKYVDKIIETEYWDDCIAFKIGQLLINRASPLYLEMLEVEDPWFEGYMGNYAHLASIIELFSESEIRVIKINGASVVTRIKSDAWELLVSSLRKSLKNKAEEGGWIRDDIKLTMSSELSENAADELFPILWGEFEESLQFDADDGNANLIGFGKSAEAAVSAVLARAEKPLHYSEIAERAAEIYGKDVSERLAHNSSPRLGARLFGRGVYGLPHHNPVSDRMSKNIKLIVAKMIADGPFMKQWHCAEIITQLKNQFPGLPSELDNYTLNIILEDVDNITYLNRMVWARSDSGQCADDRVDMADAFAKILEDNGGPLKGKELKDRLSKIRGVVEHLQIQPTNRLIQVGPDFWGLIERDISGDKETINSLLDDLYSIIKERQKGLHVSEIESHLNIPVDSKDFPTPYALLNLAQRDNRFYLGRTMFVGLSEWGDDTRRLNISQAVRKLINDMPKPMSITEISALVEDMVEMPIDITLSNVLINEGAVYDQIARTWFKG